MQYTVHITENRKSFSLHLHFMTQHWGKMSVAYNQLVQRLTLVPRHHQASSNGL